MDIHNEHTPTPARQQSPLREVVGFAFLPDRLNYGAVVFECGHTVETNQDTLRIRSGRRCNYGRCPTCGSPK